MSSGPRSQQYLSIFVFCVRRCGSGCHNSVLAFHARWDLFYGGHLVLSSHLISLLVEVPRGMCRPAGMWCDAALNKNVRNILSSPWQSVGRERLRRVASTSSLYLSQLAFFGLT